MQVLMNANARNENISIIEKFLSVKVKVFLLIIVNLLYGFSSIFDNNLLDYAGTALVILLIVFNDDVFDLYLYASLITFNTHIYFAQYGILFIPLMLSTLKLAILNFDKKLNILVIFILAYYIIICLCYDLYVVSFGQFINSIFIPVYFICFIAIGKFEKINIHKFAQCVILSMLWSLIVTFISNGISFSEYIDSIGIVRFGDESGRLVGAMGVPLYAVVSISIITIYILNTKGSFCYKVCLIISALVFFALATITISKVFLLGMAFFIIWFLTSSIINKKYFYSLIFLGGIVVLGIVGFLIAKDDIINIIEKFIYRIDSNFSTGRFAIFESVIKFCLNKPLVLLFGMGSYYTKYGTIYNELFSASAHNIVLDCLISYGLVGCILALTLLCLLIKIISKIYQKRPTMLSMMPFLCWFIMSMTGGVIWSFKTFIYVFTTIMIAVYYGKDQIKVKK